MIKQLKQNKYFAGCFCVNIYKKLANVVEGDQKVTFITATRPSCREGRYYFPWIGPLYPWCVPYIAECQARRYQVPF